MSSQFSAEVPADEGTTFYVSSGEGRLQKGSYKRQLNPCNEFDRALDKHCERPVQCYRFLDSGEVVCVFTDIKDDGTATNKRRRVSRSEPRPSLSVLETSKTSDGYGMEFILKDHGEVNGGLHLQYDSDHERNDGETPGIAKSRSKRFRMGGKRRVLFRRKEGRELFKERLEALRSSLINLASQCGGNPYIRCQHWYHEGRCFAFASAYIRSGTSRHAVVTVLWHTRTRPHRAVCVTYSLDRTSAPGQERLIANCSCCHILDQIKGIERGCYHAQVSLVDEAFTRMVSIEIRRRETTREDGNDHFSLFGEPFVTKDMSGSSKQLTVLLDRGAQRKRTLASSWLFFMTFDLDICLFAPVLKVKGKPFKCMLCRIPSSRRGYCGHEESARNARESLRRQQGSGAGLLLDLSFLSDEEVNKGPDPPVQDENDQENIGENRSVSVPQVYTPHERRPMLPCRGEWDDMIYISNLLNIAKEDDVVTLNERNLTKCHKCGLLNTKENYDGYARNIQLFTLFQGTHKIRVFDWFCHICEERRCFSGYRYGVFPAQQNSAFTTELLYQWLEMTCFQGYSFRNAYQTTRTMQRAASRQMRRKKSLGNRSGTSDAQNATADIPDDGTHRRRANDALRSFIKLLDTNTAEMTKTFFSCDKCEVPLSPSDCEELGISEEEGKSMKRLKAVVIDGTASGILTDLPSYERNHVKVAGPKSMSAIYRTHKLLKKNPHRNALKKFFKNIKTCFRAWKTSNNCLVTSEEIDSHSQTLRVWLMKSDNITIDSVQDPADALTRSEIRILQLFLHRNPCFCSKDDTGNRYPQPTSDGHSKECEQINSVFKKSKESKAVIAALRVMFSITEGNVFQELHPELVTERGEEAIAAQSQGEGSGGAVEIRDDQGGGNTESNNDFHSNEVTDRQEEDVPPQREDAPPQREREGPDQELGREFDSDNEGTGDSTMDGNVTETEDDEDENNNDEDPYESVEAQRKKVFGIWANLDLPESEKRSQFIEATLLLLEFLLTAHIALPYVGTGAAPVAAGVHVNEQRSEMNSKPLSMMLDFTKKSLYLHEDLIRALHVYKNPCTDTCDRGELSYFSKDCKCALRLKAIAMKVCRVNPTLGNFCQELIKLKKPLQSQYRILVASVIAVVKAHMEGTRKYFQTLLKHCSEQCKSYWRTCADPEISDQRENEREVTTGEDSERNRQGRVPVRESSVPEQGSERNQPIVQGRREISQGEAKRDSDKNGEDELKEAESSGICFPGRKRVRPCILFNSKNEDSCNKKYKKSRSHSPGLLTVQCACNAPRLLGFVVMTQAESTAMALSAVLSHFPIFPRTVYYDNACNLYLSTMLRVTWVLGRTRFLVDRFHFKSHNCSSSFDPDAYAEFDLDHTETAESINARIEKTLQQIRYLSGEHLVPFLRARFSFINLAATFRSMYQKNDLEDVDMTQFFQHIYKCSCVRCIDEKRLIEKED